ncbi:hypothetical protein AB685_10000 [Bacillus sp. LL01]|uniref:anti-sigma-I factor RsgI family protein n=1 Tax=Bacillus sp. LL01 TaxID=1665556 RepID=UPI00064D57AD|nr:anti-sigma factor domain-containing protein [Bacillus sp. LL01]KMJ58234.1 hypothetical protein AB685_10000 [Bacillus sp. LL01]
MKKGIVLEVHDEHVTILTPEGEFLKSRKQKGQIDLGEEIVFFPLHRAEVVREQKKTSVFRTKWAVIGVLTAIILAFSLYPKYASNQVYAYVSVDVNPSIELGVNKDMEVISMDAYNQEGEDIIKQLVDWEKKDLANVSSQIFDIFRQKGFLTENSEVLIASVVTNEDNIGWKALMQTKITTISEKVQQDKVSITTLETTIQERSDAIKEGMSPGKYIQKEKKTELVDNEDTSKTETVPSAPLNHKPLEVKHANAKDEKAGPPDFVVAKKKERQEDRSKNKEQSKEEIKERKELKELRKEKKRELQQDRKQEKKELQSQRKQEKKGEQTRQKEERQEHKHHKQNGKGERKNESSKDHHAKGKNKDDRGNAHGKNKREEKKHEHKKGNH